MSFLRRKKSKKISKREKLLQILDIDDVAQEDKRKLLTPTNTSAEASDFRQRVEDDRKVVDWVAGGSNILAIRMPAFGKNERKFWPLTAELVKHLEFRAKGDSVFIFRASPLLDDLKGFSYLYRSLSRQLLECIDDKFTFPKEMKDEKRGSMNTFIHLMRRFEEIHQSALVYFILDGLGYDFDISEMNTFVAHLYSLNAKGKKSTVRFKILLTPPVTPWLPNDLFTESNTLDLE